ncbi:MAG: amidase [Betaproteobacteria bacterium]|nr:amidase [Betaproteobacteria bacterium]
MSDIAFLPANKLARLIRARKIGCLELLEHCLERVRRHNPKLNAIIVKRLPAARKAARDADALLRKRGAKIGPLHGVPMTVKESFDVAGLPTTWGLTEFKLHRAKTHALAVERLIAAGANVFGKTNVPVMLADWQTFNPVYGTTNNPWDVARTPGGSSGGAAAALAAGLTGLEYGSDIGASIRNPAHYCGVYGHKPSYQIVSPRGHGLAGMVSFADIAAVGPLARSAVDLEIALRATAGPDPIDGAGWKLALGSRGWRSPRGLRVAVMLTHPTAEVDESVQAPIHALARFLAKSGAKVSERARPAFDPHEAHLVFIQLLRFATAGRQPDAQYLRFEQEKHSLAPEDNGYYAQFVRGNTMAPRDWARLNERRHQMRLAWAAFFREWDVLLCPTAATAAFPHMQTGERWERMLDVNGKPQPSTTQMFWAGYSGMCFLPSTVAPVGLTKEGLPVGVQIVGAQYADFATIRFAQIIEREYRAFVAPPGY